MFSEITETWKYRSVVHNFVRTTLAVRYRRSFLGYLWSVLSPLLKYAIMGIVFEIIGKFAMPNYYGYMFVGSVFFGFISTVLVGATGVFIHNEHYIKKIYVPKLVFVMNLAVSELVNFLLVLASILLLLFFMGQLTIGTTWLFLPVGVAIALIAVVGLAALLAVATVYFRDLQHLTDIFFQALFFATPIFYPEALIQKNALFSFILSINPVYYLVTLVRDPLIFDRLPDWNIILTASGIAAFFFLSGIWCLHRFNNRIIFKL